MRLYMKQKVFSIKSKATIYDEFENEKYFVEGKVISLGKKLTITNAAGEEVAFVRQKVVSFMPKFFVEINGEEVAEIAKKFSFLKPKYEVRGLGWSVEGDIFAHDYNIVSNGQVVVSIHKKWLSWGDTYEMNIDESADEVLTLAVVLAIDAVLDANQASSISYSTGD